MKLAFFLTLLTLLPTIDLGAQPKSKAPKGKPPAATDPATMVVKKDFKVELLYSVPKDQEGSWVSMCADPKGRLVVSDQYGGLFRITPPPIGTSAGTKVEKLPIPLGEAQGLLWAFDALYVVVNGAGKYKSGLYRVPSKDGDTFGPVETLKLIDGGGEHGPHAVIPGPDGKSLYVVCGNGTKMMKYSSTLVPPFWGEDHLLPRMPDGNGFMKGVNGPGGTIYHVDPEGKNWELISVGYRNPYDIAINKQGDLFTYDADMEWDFNTPWYRPTRICLATPGSEFGWRNGAGKYPIWYPDTLPGVYNVGPGSPTGIGFGYGAKFPAKYQDALYFCDWSYGKLYALHLTPHMSYYEAQAEEFITGSPLPLTDLAVSPKDGALYFAIGGRKTQSGLYRVTYIGKESTEPSMEVNNNGNEFRVIRHKLEALNQPGNKDKDFGVKAIETAWPYLDHEDRFIRFAARVVLEQQPIDLWSSRALSETTPGRAIPALLALVRAGGTCPFHATRELPHLVIEKLKNQLTVALEKIDWSKLTETNRIDYLRTCEIFFNRMGKPDAKTTSQFIAKLAPHYPGPVREVNYLLCEILVYLQDPGVAAKTLPLLEKAPTQEEQMEYAKSLRMLKAGWTMDQRKEYFSWFLKSGNFKGGMSFAGFMNNIKNDAIATLTKSEKEQLKPILDAKPIAKPMVIGKVRPFVKTWTVDDLTPELDKGLSKRNFDRGRVLFGETKCFGCHRFDNEGGSQGPDLTVASGRFSPRDLLESIILPNKEISDQYAAVKVELDDGKTVVGRIVNLNNDSIMILPDMLDPSTVVDVNRRKIEKMEKSKVSMMPEGLLNTLDKDEVLDLLAYLLSRGDRNNKMFK
jgi:putative heme-binding domain-containing protein